MRNQHTITLTVIDRVKYRKRGGKILSKATTQYFSYKLRHIAKNDYKQNPVSKAGISPSIHTAFTPDSYYQKKSKSYLIHTVRQMPNFIY